MTARMAFVSAVLVLVALASGCATNPVTGKSQLSLIGEGEERQLGQENYQPTIQTQGGRFYLDPELTVYVQEVGNKMAAVSDRPDLPYEFAVLNSNVPNAWALPGGKIAINRGLLTELENEAQLASVLGHEIVHAAARHSVQRMQQGMLLSAGMAGLSMVLADNDWGGVLMGGAAIGSQLALSQYSQSHELEADRYGIEYMVEAGYDPDAAAELQEIFVKLSEGQNPGFIDGLFATHPPSQERVEANRRLAAKYDDGGYLGHEKYQSMIAEAKRLQPAYNLHDEAIKLATDGDYQAALAKVNQAVKMAPREAAFYATRARIHKAMDNPGQEQEDLNRAVDLYPEMFSYRLLRGMSELEAGNLDAAQADLEASAQVVPTAIAYLRLGDIAAQRGNRNKAAAYYNEVAKTEGALGDEARRKLSNLQ
ncbi:M48 family metalloprotease [Marinobacter lacisalsi]|uniref:M48 family metalloprotease n=1 Tax=Marinobacter lacisalsi TaxID=475979 RepID=A0ABV8QEN0_9GAMM